MKDEVLSARAAAPAAELDPGLVRAAAAGDPHARRMLVVCYQDRVFRLLRRMVSPTGAQDDLVEDLAQDTFLRALSALPRFDPDASARLSTWLLTIATRRAIDALRAAKQARHVEAGVEQLVDGAHGAARPDRTVLARMLARAMNRLPAEQRAVFVLREYHGMDYQEIAQALRIAPGTVASRLARARGALQAALSGGGE